MKKLYKYLPFFIFFISFLLNIISWNSRKFCDFYALHLIPVWVNTLGRFSSLFPFSVGEIMIILGLLLLIAIILFSILHIILLLFFRETKIYQKIRDKGRFFYRTFVFIVSLVSLVMTLNCFILYHTSDLHDVYFPEKNEDYTLDDLASVRNFVVNMVNELSEKMERDEEGHIAYTGNLERTAIESMQNLGTEYKRLAGYYPTPKKFLFSGFISQQYMLGYYFPFSMEANYNSMMHIMNKPATMCHELAHVKGFLYEDEANFIGFLACILSDDITFQYSGYLSVLYYLDNDFYDSLGKNKELYDQYPGILPQVREDNVFLTEEAWETVEEKSLLDTEVVSRLADDFIETNLVLHGIEDGALSYNRVVGLLLDYYDGTLK